MKDTYTTPENKAFWGFGGSKKEITVSSKPAEKDAGEPKAPAKGKQGAESGTAAAK